MLNSGLKGQMIRTAMKKEKDERKKLDYYKVKTMIS